MDTLMDEERELSRKVIAYLESTCPRPPGHLRWQDYLTGDGENDGPVLRSVAKALGLTVWELLARAEGRVAVAATTWSMASSWDAACMAARTKTPKRVAARFRRTGEATQVATCAGRECDQ